MLHALLRGWRRPLPSRPPATTSVWRCCGRSFAPATREVGRGRARIVSTSNGAWARRPSTRGVRQIADLIAGELFPSPKFLRIWTPCRSGDLLALDLLPLGAWYGRSATRCRRQSSGFVPALRPGATLREATLTGRAGVLRKDRARLPPAVPSSSTGRSGTHVETAGYSPRPVTTWGTVRRRYCMSFQIDQFATYR